MTAARYTAWIGAIAGTFALAVTLFTAVMRLGMIQQELRDIGERVKVHDSWIQSIVCETQERLRELESNR